MEETGSRSNNQSVDKCKSASKLTSVDPYMVLGQPEGLTMTSRRRTVEDKRAEPENPKEAICQAMATAGELR
jgi:hypothetical protein